MQGEAFTEGGCLVGSIGEEGGGVPEEEAEQSVRCPYKKGIACHRGDKRKCGECFLLIV